MGEGRGPFRLLSGFMFTCFCVASFDFQNMTESVTQRRQRGTSSNMKKRNQETATCLEGRSFGGGPITPMTGGLFGMGGASSTASTTGILGGGAPSGLFSSGSGGALQHATFI